MWFADTRKDAVTPVSPCSTRYGGTPASFGTTTPSLSSTTPRASSKNWADASALALPEAEGGPPAWHPARGGGALHVPALHDGWDGLYLECAVEWPLPLLLPAEVRAGLGCLQGGVGGVERCPGVRARASERLAGG